MRFLAAADGRAIKSTVGVCAQVGGHGHEEHRGQIGFLAAARHADPGSIDPDLPSVTGPEVEYPVTAVFNEMSDGDPLLLIPGSGAVRR